MKRSSHIGVNKIFVEITTAILFKWWGKKTLKHQSFLTLLQRSIYIKHNINYCHLNVQNYIQYNVKLFSRFNRGFKLKKAINSAVKMMTRKDFLGSTKCHDFFKYPVIIKKWIGSIYKWIVASLVA